MKKIFIGLFTIIFISFLILVSNLGLENELQASGGYGGGGIQQDKGRIDKDKYQLGKSIYNGDFNIPPDIDEAKKFPQYERLNQIQNKLPRPEQRRVDLSKFAGRLTEEQLDSLQHFVSIRFNVRLE